MTSAREIAAAVRSGASTAVEAVTAALARIERVDPVLCAFAEVWEEAALRGARAVDERIAAGEHLPLAGVPIGVKGRRGPRGAGPLIAAGCVPVGATAVPGPGTAWQTWGLGRYGRTVNPGGTTARPAVPRRVPPPPWPPGWCRLPPAATGRARCGSRPRGAGWSG